MRTRSTTIGVAAVSMAFLGAGIFGAAAAAAGGGPVAGPNVRVTNDQGGSYVSADRLAGGSYTDGVLQRCGTDRRMQIEPTLAIDPRNHRVWSAGSNDACAVARRGEHLATSACAWVGAASTTYDVERADPARGEQHRDTATEPGDIARDLSG